MTEQTQDTGGAAAKPARKISLGRTVHYRNHSGTHAAIVTKVHEDGSASLRVFPHDAPSHHAHQVAEVDPEADVAEGAEAPHGWHWPKLF